MATVPPAAELTPQPFTPGYGYGFLEQIPSLRRLEDVVPGATQPGGLESFTDGTYVYNVSRQQFEDGTANAAFPVAITKRRLADLIRKDGGGLAGPMEGSFGQVLNPDGTVQSEGLFHPTRDSEELKKWGTGILAAAALIMGGTALAGAGAGSAGGAAAGGTAGGAAGGGAAAGGIGAAEGIGGLGAAEGAAGGSSLFGGFGTAGPVSGGFGSGITAGEGLGAFGGLGAGAGYGSTFAGSMEGLGAAGAAGAGGIGGAGGSPQAGTPPPSNPYHPGSYFNTQNLGNLAQSTMSNGSWTDWIGPVSQLIGGAMQHDAAGDAADAMSGAAREGIAEQRRQFDVVRELLAPYVQAGNTSLTAYQNLAGANGADPQRAAMAGLEGSPQFASLTKAGENAILQNASATGGLRGGNTQAALADYRTQLLGSLVDKQLGRYLPIVQAGQSSAAGTGTAALATGNSVANLLGQAGAAQAGGIVAGTNAITNTLGGIGGYFAGQNAANVSGGYSASPNSYASVPTNGLVPGFGSAVVPSYSNGGNLF